MILLLLFLTKSDKVKSIESIRKSTEEEIQVPVFVTSAEKRQGIKELRSFIIGLFD